MTKKWIGALAFLLFALPASSFAQRIHTVQPGDTLWEISVHYQVDFPELVTVNRQLGNPDLIYPGQTVKIPDLSAAKIVGNEVIELTNKERAKHGLRPLIPDGQLSKIARYKSADMRDGKYFSHKSATYGTPYKMMRDFGVSYNSAAENIAAGQRTAHEAVQAWMNSPAHRRNILHGTYTHVGAGYVSGGEYGHYWTQILIAK